MSTELLGRCRASHGKQSISKVLKKSSFLFSVSLCHRCCHLLLMTPGHPRRSEARRADKMRERAAVGALSVVLILTLGLPPGALACPHPCACYVPTEVHCTFRSLAAVPARISKHVERINFGFVLQLVANSFMFLVLNLGMLHACGILGSLCVLFKWNCRDGWLLPDSVFQTLLLLA